MKTKQNPIRAIRARILLLLALAALVAAVVVAVFRFEGGAPSLTVSLDRAAVGENYSFSATATDSGSGLKEIRAFLEKDGKQIPLFSREYRSGFFLFGPSPKEEDHFTVTISPKTLGLADGEILLRILARDHSWRKWWHGNTTLFERKLVIDTRPPVVSMVSDAHNIAPGGAGLAIYRLSETCARHGVMVGEDFFPGYPRKSHKGEFVAYFAMRHTYGRDTDMFVLAEDEAGNRTEDRFRHYVIRKRFKKDLIPISDAFLNRKMPELVADMPMMGGTASAPERMPEHMIDKFIKINNELRQANYETLKKVVSETADARYWEGAFLRLPSSARRSSFADHREYRYKNKIVDEQYHMGVDLASVARSPVPAANSGKVLFADRLGIYGNTVLIDHGRGLESMYSHLSEILVQKGDMVEKGQTVGKTGSTGLAGGDHLHFGMMVHHIFVDPVEWWDAAWIQNNITGKLGEAPPPEKDK